MAFEVIRLQNKDPRAWAIMGWLPDRIRAFGAEHDVNDPELLVRRLLVAFVTGDDAVGCWVGLKDNRIVGHLLACDDMCGGHKIGFVEQLEMQRGEVPRAIMRRILDELVAWSKAREHRRLMMVTSRYRFGAWERLFGFKPYRVMMTREHELPPSIRLPV